ncbi:hypothetical protein HD554DRAFT_564452 [Boletus coccyginus]|nr:hypothetical protein HD554DRAFT_564452 [Boletus coccyginus]
MSGQEIALQRSRRTELISPSITSSPRSPSRERRLLRKHWDPTAALSCMATFFSDSDTEWPRRRLCSLRSLPVFTAPRTSALLLATFDSLELPTAESEAREVPGPRRSRILSCMRDRKQSKIYYGLLEWHIDQSTFSSPRSIGVFYPVLGLNQPVKDGRIKEAIGTRTGGAGLSEDKKTSNPGVFRACSTQHFGKYSILTVYTDAAICHTTFLDIIHKRVETLELL